MGKYLKDCSDQVESFAIMMTMYSSLNSFVDLLKENGKAPTAEELINATRNRLVNQTVGSIQSDLDRGKVPTIGSILNREIDTLINKMVLPAVQAELETGFILLPDEFPSFMRNP